MQTKKLYPHFTGSVKALQFVNIPNPSSVNSYTDLQQYQDHYYELIDDPESGISVESTETALIVIFERSQWLNFDWNSIIARADDTEEESSYLSLSYWDYVISSNAEFDKLKISYSSSYRVVPSSDAVSVEISYIRHDIYEGTSVDNPDKWRSHLNMNREVGTTLFKKTIWVTESQNSIDQSQENSNTDNVLSTWKVNTPKNNINISTNTSGSVKNAAYECIPSCNSQGSKLMVSPRFGVEFYNPTNGNIINQVSTSSGPMAPMKPDYLDGIDPNENFEVYRVYENVFLFYVPERYAAWISNETVENNSIVWNTWRVGDNTIKVVVPSYFDIIPFVFMQKVDGTYTGEWRISHILRVCSNTSEMFAAYSSITYDVNTVLTYPRDVNGNFNSIPVEVFFTSINYINPYIENIVMGYSNADSIKKYFHSQLYVSYHTFIQALRMNEFYGSNPQMCDCGIKLGKFFVPYSQDIVTDGDISAKRTCTPIEIGEGYIVDNMIAYFNGSLISLYSGENNPVQAGVTDIQMHHGIVVGWDGSKYVQLQ